MSTMHQSQQRYLQHLAAQRFYEEESGDFTFYREEPGDFTEEELREEAAFRCWLRHIEPQNYPAALPSSTFPSAIANSFDWHYGPHAWWAWPVWSTCARCQLREAPLLCAECESYMRCCTMSEGWTDVFFFFSAGGMNDM